MWSPFISFVRLGAAKLEQVVVDIQTKTQKALQDLAVNAPHVQGVQLDGVKLSTTATLVKHGLGREVKGWMVVDQVGQAHVERVTTNEFPKANLVLTASADTTVSLWVY